MKLFVQIITSVVLALGLLAGVGITASAAAAPAPHTATPVNVVPASDATNNVVPVSPAPSLNSALPQPSDDWTRYLFSIYPNTEIEIIVCNMVAAEFSARSDGWRYACMALGSAWAIFRQRI